jgi:hypothetical protein
MTSVSEALSDILRERNELRREVAGLRTALALEVANRKQWEAWCLGAQEATMAMRAKLAEKSGVSV